MTDLRMQRIRDQDAMHTHSAEVPCSVAFLLSEYDRLLAEFRVANEARFKLMAEVERLREALQRTRDEHNDELAILGEHLLSLRRENARLRNELTKGLGPLGEGQIPLTPVEAYRAGTSQMLAEVERLRRERNNFRDGLGESNQKWDAENAMLQAEVERLRRERNNFRDVLYYAGGHLADALGEGDSPDTFNGDPVGEAFAAIQAALGQDV